MTGNLMSMEISAWPSPFQLHNGVVLDMGSKAAPSLTPCFVHAQLNFTSVDHQSLTSVARSPNWKVRNAFAKFSFSLLRFRIGTHSK